jgi:hypothetical protein
LGLDGVGRDRLATGEFPVALAEEFDVFCEGFDKLRHHAVGQYDAGDDRAWAGQIANKIEDEFGRPGDDDDAGADFPSGDVFGHACS